MNRKWLKDPMFWIFMVAILFLVYWIFKLGLFVAGVAITGIGLFSGVSEKSKLLVTLMGIASILVIILIYRFKNMPKGVVTTPVPASVIPTTPPPQPAKKTDAWYTTVWCTIKPWLVWILKILAVIAIGYLAYILILEKLPVITKTFNDFVDPKNLPTKQNPIPKTTGENVLPSGWIMEIPGEYFVLKVIKWEKEIISFEGYGPGEDGEPVKKIDYIWDKKIDSEKGFWSQPFGRNGYWSLRGLEDKTRNIYEGSICDAKKLKKAYLRLKRK